MAQDAGQAGARLPELVHVQRNVWEQVREERRQLKEQVGQLTRALRIADSDRAALRDSNNEMIAQVSALTAERAQLRADLTEIRQQIWWTGHAHEDAAAEARGKALRKLDALLLRSATTPAPADAGKEG